MYDVDLVDTQVYRYKNIDIIFAGFRLFCYLLIQRIKVINCKRRMNFILFAFFLFRNFHFDLYKCFIRFNRNLESEMSKVQLLNKMHKE